MAFEGNTGFTGEVVNPSKAVVTPLDNGNGIGLADLPVGGGTTVFGPVSLAGRAHGSLLLSYSSLSTAPVASGTIVSVVATVNGVDMQIDRFLWPVGQVVVREEFDVLVGEALRVDVISPASQLAGALVAGAIAAASV